MKTLSVLNRNFGIGDTMEVTCDQLERLADEGSYDSYDQSYDFAGFKWKISHRVANADGSTGYTLVAVEAST